MSNGAHAILSSDDVAATVFPAGSSSACTSPATRPRPSQAEGSAAAGRKQGVAGMGRVRRLPRRPDVKISQ
jgi:hypothetical protein